MAAKITSYIDAGGNKRTGYIIDGSTFQDEQGLKSVEKGSIVDAGGKRYVKGVGQNGESMLLEDYLKSRNMNTANYVDSQGILKSGYIKDGQTYADILATSPVEKGSLVSAGGKTWIKGMGADGESLLYSDYIKNSAAGKSPGSGGGTVSTDKDAEAKAEEDYAKALLELAQDREKSAAEEMEQLAKAEKLLYTRALEKAEILAAAGDFSGYRALGYSEAEIAAMEKAYGEEQFATRLKNAQQKARYGNPEELLALLGY